LIILSCHPGGKLCEVNGASGMVIGVKLSINPALLLEENTQKIRKENTGPKIRGHHTY
jgi:hypothetical protein